MKALSYRLHFAALFTILFITNLFSSTKANAQFSLIGDAKYMSGDCIQLTPDAPYSEGIAYHRTKIDLTRFFEIEFDLFLGDKDNGADGITFVIHNDPRGFQAFGTYGECIGYGRWNKNYLAGAYIAPSIAIEFDTYQNYRQNDPESDHIAFLENGTNFHEKYWSGGGGASYNLEDDQMHNFRFRWEPDTQQIIVSLDGNTVYEGQKDLINDIFEGKTQVIWGFTASTGRKFNLQYFCLKSWVKNQSIMVTEEAYE